MSDCVLIPAYCPDQRLQKLVRALQKQGLQVIVVDDGSIRGQEVLTALQKQGVPVLRHAQRCGKGRALKTGLAYAREQGFSGVVTAYADGRYSVADILRVLQKLRQEPDRLILGIHDLHDAPFTVRLSNALIRFLFRTLYRLDLRDAQSGLRGIPLNDRNCQRLLDIPYERYEYEAEMLIESKTLFPAGVEQVEVRVRETEGGQYRPFADGVSLFRVLLKVLPRFMLSSFGAFALDYALFNLLFYFVFRVSVPATVLAKVVSTAAAYFINKKLVFRSGGSRFTAKNFFLLSGILLAINTVVMFVLTEVLELSPLVMKLVVEYCLHLVNFTVQSRLSNTPGKPVPAGKDGAV